MKIKTLVGLLVIVIAFLIGSYTLTTATAQGRGQGGGPGKDWKEILGHVSIVYLDDGQDR